MSAARFSNSRSTGGFTLAEVLVAMTIFLILMGGVMTMFSAAVTGVRESYARKDTYETGRSALNVLTRDLEAAFNAREHGDVYNFYGTPYGFMFVGTLPGGQLGRVTYALRDTGQVFETDDMSAADVILANQTGAVGAGNQDIVAAISERKVTRPRYMLIRYEERGVANLNDFPLPDGYQWPSIDPVNPNRDGIVVRQIESGVPSLFDEMLRAVRSPDGTDLRAMIASLRHAGGRVEGLHAVDKKFVETLLASRKRQLWIDMVAGRRPFLNQLTAAPGDNFNNDFFARIIAQQGYVLDDFAVAEDLLATSVTDPNGNTVFTPTGQVATIPFFTYAGGDGSRVQHFNTIENLEFPNLDDTTKSLFFTDAQQAGFPRQFTTYTMLRSNMNQPMLRAFDDTLARVLSGRRGTATSLGLPMLPRLPALVEPNFVATRPPERVGGVFYERHFSQAIQVPVGLSRGLPPSLAPSPS